MVKAKRSAKVSFSRRALGPIVLVAILLCAALVVLGGMLPPPNGHEPLTIVLRYDDYSAISNTYLETQILERLSDFNLPCTFAVIPTVTGNGFRNPQPSDSIGIDAEKVALLRPYVDDGLIELALHGLTHQTVSGKSLQTLTEFSGVPYETQISRLTTGKQILESQFGHSVYSFIPPWGNYDENTLRAVEASGFSVISADPRGPALADSRLLYVPGTCRMHELKQAIAEARQLPSSNSALIMAVIHPYDFVEADAKRGVMTFKQFESILSDLSSDPSLRFTTAAGASKLISDLGAARFAAASSMRHSTIYRLLPEPFRMGLPSLTYIDAKHAVTLLERERVWCFTLYSMVLLGCAFAANRIWKFLPDRIITNRRKLLIIGYASLIILVGYSLVDMEVYAAGMAAMVGFLGTLVGTTFD